MSSAQGYMFPPSAWDPLPCGGKALRRGAEMTAYVAPPLKPRGKSPFHKLSGKKPGSVPAGRFTPFGKASEVLEKARRGAVAGARATHGR